MRYRKLDASDDMVFGKGQTSIHRDTPEAVAQSIRTRLGLWKGEWFLDTTEGTPYFQSILGANTLSTRDDAIRNRITETPGVYSLDEYSSSFDPDSRKFTVTATVTTKYGSTTVSETL